MFICRGVAYIVNNNRNTDNIASGIGKEAGDAYQNFFYYGKTAGIFNTFWIALDHFPDLLVHDWKDKDLDVIFMLSVLT